jgi:integrase
MEDFMAIKAYVDENGKTLYEVSVSARSKVIPTIRKQKRKKGLLTKAQAKTQEKRLLKTCLEEIAKLDGEGLHWGQIVHKWYEYKKVDKFEPIGSSTLTDYLAAMKTWTHEQWNRPAKQFNRGDVKRIIAKLEEEGKSKSFQSKLKGTINRIFQWGLEERLIKGVYQSPTFGITVKRKEERTPTILNKKEILILLHQAKIQGSPWYPIWAFALLTGCRNGELFALTWDDINLTEDTIRISKSYNKRQRVTKSTKGGYWRNVPINSELRGLILQLMNSQKGEFVLPRLRSWAMGYQAKELKAFCLSIGITQIRFHDLRACFATQMLQNKVPPATVMKICGWADLDTMGRYIRLSGIEEAGATHCLSFIPNQDILSINHLA